ncbi:F-box protein At1g30790-like [Apium graveolens]|uniref:F-box protein At1g30790-like n=1 Tax=Apium graveolens TaxID=4045 RepID=UPI003D79332D
MAVKNRQTQSVGIEVQLTFDSIMADQEEDRSPFTFSGDSLTEDVVMDILSRLTVKCLLEIRAVSKTWLSIISNPTFNNLQYSRAITSPENEDSFIVNCLEGNDDSLALLRLHSCRTGFDLSRPCSEDHFTYVPKLFLVGTFNDIICVLISKDPARSKFLMGTYMCQNHEKYLWNPATKQSKLLPLPSTRENKDTHSSSFGFGFDPMSVDFKVVTLGEGLYGAKVYFTNMMSVW